MKILNEIILVALLSDFVMSNQLMEVKSCSGNDEFSFLVKNIIEDLNFRDSSTNDVVLLRLRLNKRMKEKINEIFESLISAIPKENVVTAPRLTRISKNNEMREAAVIIIVSDVYDTVS
jgi:hypothetical protein